MQGDEKLFYTKSSYSNGSGDCVEVAVRGTGNRVVRDSKAIDGPTIDFTPSQWAAFMQDLGRPQFDA